MQIVDPFVGLLQGGVFLRGDTDGLGGEKWCGSVPANELGTYHFNDLASFANLIDGLSHFLKRYFLVNIEQLLGISRLKIL